MLRNKTLEEYIDVFFKPLILSSTFFGFLSLIFFKLNFRLNLFSNLFFSGLSIFFFSFLFFIFYVKNRNNFLGKTILIFSKNLLISTFFLDFFFKYTEYLDANFQYEGFLKNLIYITFSLTSVIVIFNYKKYLNSFFLEKEYFSNFKIWPYLTIITLTGFILRIWDISSLNLNGDEYRHLNAMMNFNINSTFEQPRAAFVTYILIFIKNFTSYDDIFLFKLPFVFLGTISIIGVYFLAKTYSGNKNTALLSAYLYSVLPIAIGLSRYIREYEPLMFLLIFGAIFIKKNKYLFISFLFLGAFTFYKNFFGTTTSFVLLLLFIIFINKVFFLFLKTKIYKKYSIYLTKIIIISFLPLTLIAYFALQYIYPHPINHGFLFIFNEQPIPNIFDINPIGYTWFTKYSPSLIIIFLSILTIFHSFFTKNKEIYKEKIELSLLFVITMIYFLFIGNFPYYWQGRYIYYIFPFYTIIISIGFHQLLYLVKDNIKNKNFFLIISFIFFISLYSPYNAIHNHFNEKPGNSNPYHGQQIYDEIGLCNFLKEKQISIDQIFVTRSWSLEYCLDGYFLKTIEEKNNYIDFPQDEIYELNDRKNIYTFNSIGSEEKQLKLNEILNKNISIKYLIFSTFSPNQIEPNFKYVNDYTFNLINTLPNNNVRFKYLIFEINKKEINATSSEKI